MNTSFKKLIGVSSGCAALLLAIAAYAADPAAPNNRASENTTIRSNTVNPLDTTVKTTTTHTTHMIHTWRASQLERLNVRNNAGEKIGAIEDLVIAPDGRVAYVALGFGGFLGMGEKLFAVPWQDLTIHVGDADNSESYLVLNVTKDDLKHAPGFDKAKWPNFADPNFTQGIDKYYQDHRHTDQNEVGQR